jgi:nucleoside 2-deoxyribosyltransferase
LKTFKVYLAGPIQSLTYDESEDWRNLVIASMPSDIVCYSPLRSKQFLRAYGVLGEGGEGADTYPESPLATSRGIMSRDHMDCSKADLVLCNLMGAKRVSIGTMFELAWTFSYRVPLVVCMEPKGNMHDHPMVRESINFRAQSVEEGIELTKAILLP